MEPCQLRMLLASPVGFQSEPATAAYATLPRFTVTVSDGNVPPMHFPVILTVAAIVMLPVKLVLKLYPPFTQSPASILMAPSMEEGPIAIDFPPDGGLQ